MTRKTKLSLLSGVAAVVALGAVAGMANAQMMGEGGWMPMWGHGPHPMMDRLFDRYDANKDGKVTQDEINQTRTGEFNEADPSKTGVITIDQFQQIWLKQHHLQMVRAFQRLDTKGDGKVTLDEYLTPTAGLVAKLPGVKDGAITRDELMKAMRERMHEHMGAMGGGWGHGPGAHGMMGEGGGHMGWGPPPGGPGMGQGGPQGNHGWGWGPPPGGPGMGQPGQQGMNRGWGWGRGWWGQGNGNMQQGQNGWQGQGNWQGQNGHMTENSGGDDSFDGNMVPPGSDAGAMQPPPVPQQGQGN